MSTPKKFELFVDHEKYEWSGSSITGAQLRTLAGVPDNAEIFQHVPGKKDVEIFNDSVVDLTKPGPERFSTQSPGSQAG